MINKSIECGPTSSDSMKSAHIVNGIRHLVPKKLLAEFDAAKTDSDDEMDIMEDIFDAMNDIAPHDLTFGAHIDDGACFGFWSYEDETEN